MSRILFLLITIFVSNIALAAGKTITVKIDGMTCPSCAASVEGQVNKLDGVSDIDISLTKGTATITLKEGKSVPDSAIKEAVKKAGFKAISIQPNS